MCNFLGKDEKTKRNLLLSNQNVGTVYSNIRTVYPSQKHVTTHPVLCFQRCIVMRLFYFSYKQVKHDFSLLRAYAIILGRFNITVN